VRLAEAISAERRAALRRVLAPDSASPEAKG